MSLATMLVAAIALAAASGLPAFAFPRASRAGQAITTLLLLAGSAFGLSALGLFLATPEGSGLDTPPWSPDGAFGLDAVSAVFLVLVFLVPALGAVFGLGYWSQDAHPDNGKKLGLSYGLLVAAMALVLLARDGLVLLVAWELMALAAWFAATAESGNSEVRRAGWTYLIATHVGTLALFALFSLWKSATGSFALLPSALPPPVAGWIFGLALLGFGLKAGLVPLHVWLPGAHANAPGHVSAVMSGVMLKMGVYGIVRVSSLLPVPEAWWGSSLLGLGCLSALAGVVMALGQQDLKRLLAWSSVENIGIVAMGMGLALLGKSAGRAELVVLGMGAALFHVWNHGLFKPLLFFEAGIVIHASGTRRIDRMGGLSRSLPLAALLFALASVAVAGLPPLNGFVGEWFLYVGFFRALDPGLGAGVPVAAGSGLAAAAAGAAVLAAVGALSAAAFVRAFGAVFLGSPRREPPVRHRLPATMALPVLVLAALCLLVGVLPGPAASFLSRAAREWAGLPPGAAGLEGLAPLSWVGPAALFLGVGAGFALLLVRLRSRRGGETREARPTWDCGYAAPSARMQYTASSFSEFPLRGFALALGRRFRRPRVEGAFPRPAEFAARNPDPVLDRLLRPLAARARRLAPRIRVLQQGQTQLYLLYILAATGILLLVGLGLT